MQIPITRPALSEEEVSAVARVVRSGWLTQGPEVAKFEAAFAQAVGAEHAVAVSNCTVALELALRCAGVQSGDDVVTVSHSFIATANAVRACGARPVFVDVEESTFGMNAAALEAALTPKTRAIMCVHQIGMPCDLPGILQVAERHRIPVVEDAACAIGSEVELDGSWRPIGKPNGLFACFSLHPRKIVTTGDGGMITTADPKLAARLRLLRQHGMSVPDTVRHGAKQVIFEEYVEPAFNFRMTDLQASVGLPQLERLPAIVAERRQLAARYAQALADSPLFVAPSERPGARSNWQSYALRLRPEAGIGQVEAMQFFLDRGIATKRGISNAHQEPAYADRRLWSCGVEACAECAAGNCRRLAVSERLRDTTILIPLFHGMASAEQEYVIETCQQLATRGPA
jgi:dTDP-4-amino-4,6-dideoxygalactose transaminase